MVGCKGDKCEEKALEYNNASAMDGGRERGRRRERLGKEEGEIREE